MNVGGVRIKLIIKGLRPFTDCSVFMLAIKLEVGYTIT